MTSLSTVRLAASAAFPLIMAACSTDLPGEPDTRTPDIPVAYPTGGINVPGIVAGSQTYVDISAGDVHTCAISVAGRAMCWGAHAVGLTWAQRAAYPAFVDGNHTFNSIASGVGHTCGSTSTSVYCWGLEAPFGELDGGGNWNLPRPLITTTSVSAVVAGQGFSCGLRDGTAICWGFNPWGQLGSGSTSPAAVKTAVAGDITFARLGRTSGHTICGLTTDGRLYCWGRADTGQLADAPTEQCLEGPCASAPTPVLPELRFRAVASGPAHTCAVSTDGVAWCWGLNGEENRLGSNAVERGPGVIIRSPVAVTTAARFIDISVGWDHACGIDTEGAGHCWGSNHLGQLGSGLTAPWWYAEPVVATFAFLPMHFTALDAGNRYTCGISFNNTAWCWGRLGEHLGRGPVY